MEEQNKESPMVQSQPKVNQPVSSPPQNSSKRTVKMTLIFILASTLIAFLVGGFVLGSKEKNDGPRACTQEAKQCPDGSYVARTGPNCEFSPCPTPTLDPTASWKTYTSIEGKFGFKYPQDWYFKTAKENYGSDYQGARVEILFSNKLNKNNKIPSGVEIDRHIVTGIIAIDKCKYVSGCEIWTEETNFYDIKNPLWQGSGGGLCSTNEQQVNLSDLGDKKAILIKSNSDSKYEMCKGAYSIQYNVLLSNEEKEHLTLTFGYNNQNEDNSKVLDKFDQILQTFRFSD